MSQQANILFFDSGVGGLSIYQAVKAKLGAAQYIYAFDNAGFPYGELEPKELIARTHGIIERVMQKHAIDLVVIACNTASTVVLPSLRAALNIPVVGVVPAIKPAAACSKMKSIGLLATPATVNRDYTRALIEEFASDCQVLRLGSTRLVEIAEEKLMGDAVDCDELAALLAPWDQKVDCIVLGCTHFPLLREELKQVLSAQVAIVDSGDAIAERVAFLLNDDKLQSTSYIEEKQKAMTGIAYCAEMTAKVARLQPALQSLGFEHCVSLDFPRCADHSRYAL
ncbi:Glutamate racemase [Vibrio stylophorae]|uniref:Glutamate racemase n=1 Tax=Vibrio stylophorae TaxID=659351 RepID=A0ABM8ZPX5_9VIBR|nr:glutamate racemase [Vibrio stylophorae]CAH0532355.1 Glutamate racemase [Vibrio stylophorae]